MITGTAMSAEPAMTTPQSVARFVSTRPCSHSGSVCLRRVRHDDERERVLVPRLQERVHACGDEARGEQRERDPEEGGGARQSVDHRGLLELDRHAGHEAAQHPDGERQDRGGVDDRRARSPC